MTKGELKKALEENLLPDDSEMLIAVGESRDEEHTWNEIAYVDETKNGIPILIGVGRMVMEQGE